MRHFKKTILAMLAVFAFMLSARAESYVLEALFAEAPVSMIEDVAWTLTGERIGHISALVDDDRVAQARREHPELFDPFPALHLKPGEREEINHQNPIRYGASFDGEGNPLEHAERGVGKRIAAQINEVQESVVDFDIDMERAELVGWVDHVVEGVDATIPQPVFSSRNLRTKNLNTFLDQWLVMGGLIREEPDKENVHLLILFKVSREDGGINE